MGDEGDSLPRTWADLDIVQKGHWLNVVIVPALQGILLDDCDWVRFQAEYGSEQVETGIPGMVQAVPNGIVSCSLVFYRKGLDRRIKHESSGGEAGDVLPA